MKIITVYTQPGCQPCRAVKRWLDKRDVEYQTVDISTSPADLEAVKALGYQAAPVTIISSGDPETDIHWHGFIPDLLSKYTIEEKAAA